MNQDFKKACEDKFDKGHKEHDQPWDLEHIDHIQEIQDELTDLYNYASLDPKDKLMSHIMVVAEQFWVRLNNR